MFLENFKNFITYYGKNRYFKLAGFTFMSFIAGCLEFLGIALIYPFVLLIIKPEAVPFAQYIHIQNDMTAGLLIGFSVLLIFILKNTFIILSLYLQSRFVSNWKQDILKNFMEFYIYAPYKSTMKLSPSDKLYTLTTLVNTVIDNFVMRILNVITNIIIIAMIVLFLLIKFPIPAFVTIIFAGFTIVMQNKFFKSRTAEIAKVMNERYLNFQNTLLQNINNIKEIQILSKEEEYLDSFKNSFKNLKETQIMHLFYCSIPPYIVEILVVLTLILMAFILSIQNINNNSNLIASFAIVVAALFRIAPALNRIQSSIIAINTSREFVKQLNNEYKLCNYGSFAKPQSAPPIKFYDKIELKNISFSYNSDKPILNNIFLTINKGDFIGIIGLSGAGKSTLADLLLGLLPADSGEILVDGIPLNYNNYSSFRKIVGYVPQQISLLDKSIAENVAFSSKNIDTKKVIKALEEAQLYDVIESLPEGINSNVIIGSNGLSQGQKQRLAVARALYNEPEIIVLDEATSALDVQTENELTSMLAAMTSKKTIISIAHRISTLKACNKIVYMKNGKIIDIGTFEELSKQYPEFENIIKLSNLE